jgi:hypothetical protein
MPIGQDVLPAPAAQGRRPECSLRGSGHRGNVEPPCEGSASGDRAASPEKCTAYGVSVPSPRIVAMIIKHSVLLFVVSYRRQNGRVCSILS